MEPLTTPGGRESLILDFPAVGDEKIIAAIA